MLIPLTTGACARCLPKFQCVWGRARALILDVSERSRAFLLSPKERERERAGAKQPAYITDMICLFLTLFAHVFRTGECSLGFITHRILSLLGKTRARDPLMYERVLAC